MKLYHITPKSNIASIMEHGLVPSIGPRSSEFGERNAATYFFASLEDAESSLMNWFGEEFDEETELRMLEIDVPESFPIETEAFEIRSRNAVSPQWISVMDELELPFVLNETSGQKENIMDFYYTIQGKMSESEFVELKETIEKNDKLEMSVLETRGGNIIIDLGECQSNEIDELNSTVIDYLKNKNSDTILKYFQSGKEVHEENGLISKNGLQSYDINKILDQKIEEKQKEFQKQRYDPLDGFENKETRNLNLRIHSDPDLQASVMSLGDKQTSVVTMSKEISSLISESMEQEGQRGLSYDLASMALFRVNFDQIADRVKGEIMEENEQNILDCIKNKPEEILDFEKKQIHLKEYELTEPVLEAILKKDPDFARASQIQPWMMNANLTDLAAWSKDQNVIENLPDFFKDDEGNVLPYTKLVEIENDIKKEAIEIIDKNREVVDHWLKMNSRALYDVEGEKKALWVDPAKGQIAIGASLNLERPVVMLDHAIGREQRILGAKDMEHRIMERVTKVLSTVVGLKREKQRMQENEQNTGKKQPEKMTYQEWKQRGQEEFNRLPFHYSFSKEQFKEEMTKMGLTEQDTDKIKALSGTGGFYHIRDERVVNAYLEKQENERTLHDLMEKDHDFAVSAFKYEMDNHEYPINLSADWDVCNCFAEQELKYDDTKGGKEYLKEAGYSQNVIDAYNEARNIVRKTERAKDILESFDMIGKWEMDCVEGNLPEIGQSALCVDLEDERVFREYEPCGEVTPKDENTVVVSVFSGQDAIPENEEAKRQMMWKIEREARASLVEALIERDMQQKKENERKLEQQEEQAQKKGRSR